MRLVELKGLGAAISSVDGQATTAPKTKSPWLFVIVGTAMAFVMVGSTQSFGIYLRSMTEELEIGRATFALAIAILQLATGLPVAAYLADRYGHWKVMLPSGVVYSLVLLAVSQISSGIELVIYLGIIGGLAVSGASMTVVVGAIGQMVPVERRSTMLGIVIAGASAGIFVLVPLWQQMLTLFGWRINFMIFAAVPLLVGVMAFLFLRAGAGELPRSRDVVDEPFAKMLARARRNRGYLLLTAGFFVCGFHVGFISTHLPAYLADGGVGVGAASLSLAMIGLFNIFGSTLFGRLGDRFRRSKLLSLVYSIRGVVLIGLLVLPLNSVTAIAFGASMGFVWLATVPLTSSTVAQLLGARYLAVMFGTTFFSHQIGSFIGIWMGGRVYDSTSSYDPIWLAAIFLAFAAAALHYPIKDALPRVAAAATA